jgi:hypothetical protein
MQSKTVTYFAACRSLLSLPERVDTSSLTGGGSCFSVLFSCRTSEARPRKPLLRRRFRRFVRKHATPCLRGSRRVCRNPEYHAEDFKHAFQAPVFLAGGAIRAFKGFEKCAAGFICTFKGFEKCVAGFICAFKRFGKCVAGYICAFKGFGKRAGGFIRAFKNFEKRAGGFIYAFKGFSKRAGGFGELSKVSESVPETTANFPKAFDQPLRSFIPVNIHF